MAPSALPVSRSDPRVRAILSATFPDYRGRKVRVARFDRPLHLDLSWSGGTIDKVALIDFRNGRIGHLVVPAPWSHGAADPVDCPAGALLVVRSYFLGVDAGVTIYVRPDSLSLAGDALAGLLPGGDS
jgi:hypothetical protein